MSTNPAFEEQAADDHEALDAYSRIVIRVAESVTPHVAGIAGQCRHVAGRPIGDCRGQSAGPGRFGDRWRGERLGAVHPREGRRA